MGTTVLVAGAGYLGEALADALDRRGDAVVALTHSPMTAGALGARKPYPVRAADLAVADGLGAVAGEFGGDSVGAVVHCASSGRGGAEAYHGVYLEGCRNVRRHFPRAHLVFTSSTSVYGQRGGETVDESSAAGPGPETGRVLRRAEDVVLAGGGTVARLAGIYGPGRSVLLRRFLDGEATIDGDPADPAAPGRHLNHAHRHDIVTALLTLLDLRAAAVGEVFNVADDTPMTQRDLYAALTERFGLPFPAVAPPDPHRKRGWTDKRVANLKLRSLGWRLAFPSFLDAIDHDPDLVPSIVGA